MSRNNKILSAAAIIFIAIFIGLFFYRDGLREYLSLNFLKSNLSQIKAQVDQHPLISAMAFFGLYSLSSALALPDLTVLSLAAGALFGLINGVLLVSFASTFGATITFYLSRTWLKKIILIKFGKKLEIMNSKIDKDCAFYLLTLRLLPASPFLMVNILMGVTNLRAKNYIIVTQLGMLLSTVIYVNAGLRISSIQSVADIFSLPLILALAGLSILPISFRMIVRYLKLKVIK